MPGLKLYLFGSPRLEWHNTLLKITRRRAMALLSYLAVTAKIHERDALATLFWPDSSQSQASMKPPMMVIVRSIWPCSSWTRLN